MNCGVIELRDVGDAVTAEAGDGAVGGKDVSGEVALRAAHDRHLGPDVQPC